MSAPNDGKTEQAPQEGSTEPSQSQPLREAWLTVLGVFHSAESEVQKAAGRLIESFGLQATDGSAQGIAKELMARMKRNRDDFEKKVEDGVKAALQKVREPIDREVIQIRARIEELGRKLEDKGRVRLGRQKDAAPTTAEGAAPKDAAPKKSDKKPDKK